MAYFSRVHNVAHALKTILAEGGVAGLWRGWVPNVQRAALVNMGGNFQHNKTNKVTCAPSEDSDQPGHPPSLIRAFAVRLKEVWLLSYP